MMAANMPGAALCRPGEVIIDLRERGLRLLQNPRFFCFSGDAARLAEFAAAAAPGAQNVIELGSGNGGLTFCLWAKLKAASCAGLEIMPANVDLARRSIELNQNVPGLLGQIRFVLGDWRSVPQYFPAAGCDLAVSNPPFWRAEAGRLSPCLERRAARSECFGGLNSLIGAAAYILKPGGIFCLLLPEERQREAAALLSAAGFEVWQTEHWQRRVLFAAARAV